MNVSPIVRRRLLNQGLTGSGFGKPEGVVRWLGAVQAQDYPGALWSVGLRMRNATAEIVEQAVADRRIVRTWPMRGTLHFVAPEDVRWMLGLLTPRIIAKFASYYRRSGLTEATFTKSKGLITRVLRGGNQLTRPELYDLLEKAGIRSGQMRGLFILGYLAMKGVLVFGARRGKQHTFTLLDEWIPPGKSLSRDESLAELARRYFASHGPATLQDLMWWSGLTTGEAKSAVELAADGIRREEIHGITYWEGVDRHLPRSRSPANYFLQGYDEYVIAYKDRRAIIDAKNAKQMATDGSFFQPLVLDGLVAAFWKRELRKDGVVITVRPFKPFSKSQVMAATGAAERYGRFLNLPINLAPIS